MTVTKLISNQVTLKNQLLFVKVVILKDAIASKIDAIKNPDKIEKINNQSEKTKMSSKSDLMEMTFKL